MRLWAKPKTDEQYIEFVRAKMNHRRTLVALHICAVLLFLLLLPLVDVFFSWLLSGIPIDLDYMGQWGAVIDGKMAGWGFTFGVCSAILGMRVLRRSRAEHLLIKFHTELGTRACGDSPADPGRQQTKPGRRTLTDKQYVACIRKATQWTKWISLVFFCVAAVCLSASLIALRSHWITVNAHAYKDTWRGLAIGLSGGALQALATAGFMVSAIGAGQYICGYRTERLMLKFHDERRLTEG